MHYHHLQRVTTIHAIHVKTGNIMNGNHPTLIDFQFISIADIDISYIIIKIYQDHHNIDIVKPYYKE